MLKFRARNLPGPRVYPIGAMTQKLEGKMLTEMAELTEAGCRAFTQAVMLRKRAGFTGEIRATGDVLVDQLQQMARSGFDVAELRADQDLAAGQRQLDRYAEFYQADVVQKTPHFVKATEKVAA